jgi:AraC family transcriptional regulator of arabinose operon
MIIKLFSWQVLMTTVNISGWFAADMALYKPGEINDYKYDHQHSTEVYWIHFTGYGVESVLKNLNLYNESFYNAGMNMEYNRFFDSIIREMQLKRPYYLLNTASFFLLLISSFARNVLRNNTSERSLYDSDISRVIEHMQRDFNLNIPITAYAKECNMSINWFISRFRKQTGSSPLSFINSIKIDKSKYLLSNTLISINEISAITGYENIYYFSQSFKKNTGLSPSKFREIFTNAAESNLRL